MLYITPAIVQPGFMIPDGGGEPGGGDGMSSEDDSSGSSFGVVIGISVVGSFLVLGVVAFLVVLCLLIRHKRKASSYDASLMCPVTFHNHNGYVQQTYMCTFFMYIICALCACAYF